MDALERAYPGIRDGLARLPPGRFGQMLAYKMLMVPRVADCVGNRIPKGAIRVALKFKMSEDAKRFIPDDVTVDSTRMTPAQNDLALACIKESFTGSAPVIEGQESQGYVMHTGFSWPASADGIYDYADLISSGNSDVIWGPTQDE